MDAAKQGVPCTGLKWLHVVGKQDLLLRSLIIASINVGSYLCAGFCKLIIFFYYCGFLEVFYASMLLKYLKANTGLSLAFVSPLQW